MYRLFPACQANWVKHTLLGGLFSRPYSAGVRLLLTRQPNWAKRTIRQFGLYRPNSAYQPNWVKHTLLDGLFSRPYSAGVRLFLTRQPNWAKHTIRQFDLYRPNSAYQANWVKHSPRQPCITRLSPQVSPGPVQSPGTSVRRQASPLPSWSGPG